MGEARLTKGPGHPQRIAVNGNAGAEVSVEFGAVPTQGNPLRIIPWSQIDIRPLADVRCAWIAGEIAAGRYFTVPAGSIRTIVGPGLSSRLFMLADGAGATTVEVEVFE